MTTENVPSKSEVIGAYRVHETDTGSRRRCTRGIASRAFTTRFRSRCSIWPGSALDRLELTVQSRDQLDVLADQPPQHAVDVGDHRVQVDDLGLQHLPAG